MKKWIVILIIAFLAVIAIIMYKYTTYKNELLKIQKLNKEYEEYIKGEISGTSLMTLINKTVDLNNKNGIKLDENNLYIQNSTNSIKIDVKFLESDKYYPMENIAKSTSESFIKNYAGASFKCTKKTYHEKTNNIKYLLFEQQN